MHGSSEHTSNFKNPVIFHGGHVVLSAFRLFSQSYLLIVLETWCLFGDTIYFCWITFHAWYITIMLTPCITDAYLTGKEPELDVYPYRSGTKLMETGWTLIFQRWWDIQGSHCVWKMKRGSLLCNFKLHANVKVDDWEECPAESEPE